MRTPIENAQVFASKIKEGKKTLKQIDAQLQHYTLMAKCSPTWQEREKWEQCKTMVYSAAFENK